jgi:hypothetical protein
LLTQPDSAATTTTTTTTTQPPASTANTPEQIAKQVIRNNDDYKDVTNVIVSRVIPNVLGGTLCIFSYEWEGYRNDICVFVK